MELRALGFSLTQLATAMISGGESMNASFSLCLSLINKCFLKRGKNPLNIRFMLFTNFEVLTVPVFPVDYLVQHIFRIYAFQGTKVLYPLSKHS